MTSSPHDPTVYTRNIQDLPTRAVVPDCIRWERGRPVRSILKWTRARLVWTLLALVGFAVMSGTTRMALTQSATVTLISAGDTTLKQGTPNANQGAETLLHIQQGGTQRALVRFDQQALEQAIGNSSIRSAKLRLFIAANGNNWGTDGREVNVHRLTQPWTEVGATWNCPNDTNTGNANLDCSPGWEMGGSSLPPFATAPTHVILHQNNQSGWVEWDVTGDVRTFLTHQENNYGWIIRKDDEGAAGQVDYASRENTNPPQLVVELGDPVPPTGAGLTAISDADVRSGSPNQNQGNRMRLQVQSSGTNRALVQFDRQAMLATVGSGTLQTAKLRMYVISNANNWGPSGRAVNVHRMTQTWTEQGTTWNCASDLNPFNSQSDCTPGWNMSNSSQWPFAAAATHSIVQQNNQTGWVEWNVTSDVAQILSNSVPNYGWLIRKDNEGQSGQVEYGSRESLYKAELRLTVQGSNQAPQVSAGVDQTIALPSPASLVGAATDDGLPLGSVLAYTWSQVSGTGTASFNTPSSAETTVAFSLPGTYALKLTVSDSQLSATDEVTIVVNPPPPVNQAPQVSAGPDQTITLPAVANLSGSATDDGLPAGGMLSSTWSVVGNPAPVTFGNANQPITTATFTVAGSYVLRLTASDSLLSRSYDVTITVNPPSQQLPSDPVTVAPPLDRTVATTLLAATQFLYTGSNPIQTGVAPGTITQVRAAVLRGKVITRDGLVLSGVRISVLNHPEFGETLSRADGMFDLAVNGGSLLTVNYEKGGLLPAQRQVNVPWQNYAWLPTVALIPYDTRITPVDLGSNAPIQVARGSVVTDLSGSRQTSLFFRSGTAGTLVLADGSSQPISNLHVRVTEYTVGPRGNLAMPAALPPNSAYTHCVSLTTDEAVAVAARSVRFSQPVLQYVENYQGFPTGTSIPEGYYDRETAAWVASDNGVVVHILAITSGEAILDVDGSNSPATPQAYSTLGITGPERQQLAALYQPGQSLWRIPVSHFSDWDSNMGYSSGTDSRTAGVSPPSGDNKTDCADLVYSSIIECQNQVLRQNIPLTGTPFSLHYSSDRVPGRKSSRTLEIPLSGAVVPSSLKAIDLEIQVMGRQFNYGEEMAGDVIGQSFPPAPQQTFAFEWDGKDAYGRSVQGEQRFKVRIGYRYDAVYQAVPRFGYNGNGIRITQNGTLDGRREVTLWQDWLGGITFNEEGLGTWDSRPLGLGGWDLSVHHSYDPIGRKLYLGNGSERSVSVVNPIQLVAGTGPSSGSGSFSGDGGAALQARLRYPDGIAIAPDGSVYIADSNNSRIRRVGADGIITTVAGGNVAACTSPTAACGDGGPATLARLGFPEQIQFGTDGSLYIADASFRRIRKVSADGTISTVAGTGVSGFSGDGGLATQASLRNVQGLALAPDGSLYIGDTANHRIRRVSTDGLITTVAGTGIQGYSGDGGPAALAQLAFPTQLAVGPEGAVYFADEVNHRIRKIGVDGLITTVTGGPTRCFPPTEPCGDGGPAEQATLNSPGGLAFGSDGSLYVSDTGSHRIRRITPTGVITTVAGGNGFGYSGDGGASNQALLFNPKGIAVSPDASLYFADQANHRVRKVSMALPDFTASEIVIPDESGTEVYVFDAQGRHLRTQDAFTNGVLYQFSYDAAGLLSTVADSSGNVTTIERNSSNPTAIVSPYGQRTTLTTDTNGYLAGITNPANESQTIVSTADGLMNTFRDPKGQLHQFQYTAAGRLMRDADPAGGFTTLDRQATTGTDYAVTRTTSLGHSTQYNVENLATGEERQTTTYPDGTQSVSIRGPDGRVRTTMPGGEAMESLSAPDPRWNLMAPFGKSSTVTTPEGLISTVTTSRTVSLGNPADLFTLTTQADSVTVNNRTFTRLFDAATRTSITTTPEARQSSQTIDLLGRIIRTQLASLHPVQFSYDTRGRLQSTNHGSGSDTRSLTFGYNSSGYLETVTDPLLRVTQFEYDPVGRVKKQTLPGNREIQFNYDANGNLTSLTPPGKPQHAFDYTSVDLMNEYDPPTATNVGTRVTTYAYDTERKPTLITRPDGQTVDFDYDTAGRLSTLNLPSRQLTYVYNATTGNLTSITDSAGSSLSYTYDGSLPKSSTWTGPVSGSIAWNYDNNFRVTSRSINGANQIDFGYDNDSLLTQAGALTLSRNPQNGLLTGTTLGNVTDSWIYNNFAEPTAYTASVAGTSVFSTNFTRDKLGRITSKTETIQGVTDSYVYGYDSAGRLERVTKNGSTISQYTYDANGNRLTRATAAGIATYTTDNQDRLTTWNLAPDTWNLTYTANGELQSKTKDNETTTYQYDVVGNLRHVTLPDGTQIDYIIDARNRRVGKKVNGVLVQGWLYGNQLNPIAELDGSNQIVSTFIYGSRANVPDYVVKGGVTYRIISDHLGSPRLVINTTDGSIAQRLDYDEFGNITGDTNPGFQPFVLGGGLYDTQTKVTRFGARDYDAESSRWTAKDPIAFNGGDTNFYGYVLSDPINLVDPSGLAYDLLDIGFFFWSLYDFIKCPGWDTGIGLGLDAIGLLPVVPAIGSLRRIDDLASATNRGTVVIGENMARVEKYAAEIGAEIFQGRTMEANRLFIQEAKSAGKQIIDIGPDFNRRAERVERGIRPDSPFYNMERMETKGYEGYQKLFERNGKYGGTP